MTDTTPAATDEVRQLLVHPAAWPNLTAWLDARGIDAYPTGPAAYDGWWRF